jgi:hypothetical protein
LPFNGKSGRKKNDRMAMGRVINILPIWPEIQKIVARLPSSRGVYQEPTTCQKNSPLNRQRLAVHYKDRLTDHVGSRIKARLEETDQKAAGIELLVALDRV